MNRTQSSPLSSSRSHATAQSFIGRKSPQAYIWILVACGVVLSVGFVRAAAQHIAAVNHGYECEKLRSEQVALLAEQKRLQLTFNEVTAPRNLESVARQQGLIAARASQLRSSFEIQSGEAKQVALNQDFAKQASVKQTTLKQASLKQITLKRDDVKQGRLPNAPALSPSITSNARRTTATGR